jgi:hypothetical protein
VAWPDARAVLHALGDAAWLVDAATLALLEMNAAAAELLGACAPAGRKRPGLDRRTCWC